MSSSSVPIQLPISVSAPAPKQPSIMLYGLVLLLLGLAVLFLINRVKAIDQRQRMLETQQQQQLTEDDIVDIAHAYLSNPDNSHALKRLLAPHVEAALDNMAAQSVPAPLAPPAAPAPAHAPPAPAPPAPPAVAAPVEPAPEPVKAPESEKTE
jgi:uncharacterized membrane protein